MDDRPFPHLAGIFAQHPERFEELEKQDDTGSIRARAEAILARPAARNVGGIEKLAADFANAQKFYNLCQEVLVGALFRQTGAEVTLLDDAGFGSRVYTPDLMLRFNGGRQVLVEVTTRSAGAVAIGRFLFNALSNDQLPVHVEPILGLELSSTAIKYHQRSAQEGLAQNAVSGALGAFRKDPTLTTKEGVIVVKDVDTDPEVHVGPAAKQVWERAWTNQGFIACFLFSPSRDKGGSFGGCLTTPHWIDEQSLKAAFLHSLEWKSARREALPKEHADTPFVVAYVSEEPELLPVNTGSALTGSRAWLSSSTAEERRKWVAEKRASRHSPLTQAIENGYQSGWGPLLDEWDHGPDAEMPFMHPGAFLAAWDDEAFAWASGLSAVLIVSGQGHYMQWLPNPFAKAALNAPWLQHIGFPVTKEGEQIVWRDSE